MLTRKVEDGCKYISHNDQVELGSHQATRRPTCIETIEIAFGRNEILVRLRIHFESLQMQIDGVCQERPW